MQKRIIVGIIGSILLLLAGFSSTVRVPVMGGIEGYIYTGVESVLIIFVFSIMSFIFILMKKFKVLRFTGIAILVYALLLYIYANTILSKIRAGFEAEYIAESSIPNELAEIAVMQPVEIMFGYVLLLTGAILIIITTYIRVKHYD